MSLAKNIWCKNADNDESHSIYQKIDKVTTEIN